MEKEAELGTLELGKLLAEKDKDWFLVSLLNIVNRGTIEFGITLNVGGSVVSGTLISGKKYFEEFAALFSAALGPQGDSSEGPSVEESFRQLGQIYDMPESGEGEEHKQQGPVSYIHLNNASVFFTDGTIPSNAGVLWRGKLSSVDGFNLGSLTRT